MIDWQPILAQPEAGLQQLDNAIKDLFHLLASLSAVAATLLFILLSSCMLIASRRRLPIKQLPTSLPNLKVILACTGILLLRALNAGVLWLILNSDANADMFLPRVALLTIIVTIIAQSELLLNMKSITSSAKAALCLVLIASLIDVLFLQAMLILVHA